MVNVEELSKLILTRREDLRVGQILFNELHQNNVPGTEECRASTWDPYYTMHSLADLSAWLNDHADFSEGEDGKLYITSVHS